MKRKIIIATLFIFGLTATTLFAQSGTKKMNKSPEEASEFATKRLTNKLDLSEKQSSEVQEILLSSFTEGKQIKDKYPDLKDARIEIKEIKSESRTALKSILTANQFEELQTIRKENRQEGKPKFDPNKEMPSPKDRAAKMAEELELDESQKMELVELFGKSKKEIDAVKKKYPEMEKVRVEMKELHSKTSSQMKGVLTPDQFEQYSQMKHSKKRNVKGKCRNK